jgi:hypothetical protein
MAFSLKWLFAGATYVAVAAAALSTGHWAYVDVLWAVTFFAIVYAVIVALFARGGRQRVAGGFATASLLLLACLYFSPDSIPTARLVVLAAAEDAPPAPRLVTALYAATMSPASQGGESPMIVYGGGYRVAQASSPSEFEWIATYRAANAVGTMLAGLIGGLMGALAFRRQTERD